jgi:hypothetical protein
MYSNVNVGGVLKPLIGYILFNDAPADITVSGVNWTIQWSGSGIITFAKG